ncbi:hypothetical protein EDC01DRAFT_410034 [Geopyxis carbonaria]|nr:hypothetical protein EDC01DRAFT_410034 [Geopyxis carbonaria]
MKFSSIGLSLLSLFTSAIAAHSAQWLAHSLDRFEARFLDTQPYQLSNESIKLIGYKTVHIPPTDRAHYATHAGDLDASAFYDPHAGTLRIYFPVASALLHHDAAVIEANDLGELDVTSAAVAGDAAVLGRKQTPHVTGVAGNDVRDGVIYLAPANQPHHARTHYGTVYVYDFGAKILHSHSHSHDDGEHGFTKRDGKASCMKNHGGRINCSNRFGIHNGRCARRSDVCVDYNGFWTDCRKGGSRWRNFPGSDCFTALQRGHCWNEVM